MREAQRSYEANLNVIGATRRMIQRTIDHAARLSAPSGKQLGDRTMASPISAANAYAKLARLADPSASLGKAAGGEAGGPNFGAMVKDAIGSVVEAGKKSDGAGARRWRPARRTSSTW